MSKPAFPVVERRRPSRRAALLLLASAATLSSGQAPRGLEWPTPAIAGNATLSSIGDHVNINGVPARIYRYMTDRRPEEVENYFRAHVERDFARAGSSKALPGQTAVAGRVGDFWVTLQVRQEGVGTVGTWSAVPQFRSGVREAVQRPAGFPASARLIQQVDSFDDDKRSQMAVGVDPGPVDGVAQRLDDELQEQGFTKQPTPQANWPAPGSYVAVFRKAREEVLVTLNQETVGTSVMINRISALEELK